jgi:hypothetical protein
MATSQRQVQGFSLQQQQQQQQLQLQQQQHQQHMQQHQHQQYMQQQHQHQHHHMYQHQQQQHPHHQQHQYPAHQGGGMEAGPSYAHPPPHAAMEVDAGPAAMPQQPGGIYSAAARQASAELLDSAIQGLPPASCWPMAGGGGGSGAPAGVLAAPVVLPGSGGSSVHGSPVLHQQQLGMLPAQAGAVSPVELGSGGSVVGNSSSPQGAGGPGGSRAGRLGATREARLAVVRGCLVAVLRQGVWVHVQ